MSTNRMSERVFDDPGGLQSGLASLLGQALLADAGRLQERHGTRLDVLTVEVQVRI